MVTILIMTTMMVIMTIRRLENFSISQLIQQEVFAFNAVNLLTAFVIIYHHSLMTFSADDVFVILRGGHLISCSLAAFEQARGATLSIQEFFLSQNEK